MCWIIKKVVGSKICRHLKKGLEKIRFGLGQFIQDDFIDYLQSIIQYTTNLGQCKIVHYLMPEYVSSPFAYSKFILTILKFF